MSVVDKFLGAALGFALLVAAGPVSAEDEISLFDGQGAATAYVAADEGMVIYLWGGKPVAYLASADGADGFDVYGFNGKHLGWFVRGVIWDHAGAASCATKDAIQSTQFQPFKAFKQFVPYKAYKQYAPYRPYLTNSFGQTPCELLLAEGSE